MIKKLTQRYIKANFPPELVGAESGGALLCNPDEESYMGPNFSAQIFRELSDRQNAGQLQTVRSFLNKEILKLDVKVKGLLQPEIAISLVLRE